MRMKPVDMLEKRVNIVGSFVVIAQVIGMLPHITGEDGKKSRDENVLVAADAKDTQ